MVRHVVLTNGEPPSCGDRAAGAEPRSRHAVAERVVRLLLPTSGAANVGHLFGERYKAVHVETAAYMKRLARYVVLNPVRAKMVERPEDFCGSSYRATAGLEAASECLRVAALMPYFGEDEKWRETYAEFVREGIANADPIWRGLRRNIFLWSEQWLESVKQHIKVSRRKADIPHDQRAAGRPAMTRIVKTITAKLGVKTSAIQDEHGGHWREVAAWLRCTTECGSCG